MPPHPSSFSKIGTLPSPLTPIHNLSDDILLILFKIMVHDEAINDESSLTQYPWKLAAVCTHWRDLSIQGAALWSSIHFPWHRCTGSTVDVATADTSCAIFKPRGRAIASLSVYLLRALLQLERSRNAPLAIHADFSCHCHIQIAYWTAILSHSVRWEELYLYIEKGEKKRFLEAIPNSAAFSNLRRIWIRDDSGLFRSQPMPFHAECVRTIGNLHSLTLSGRTKLVEWTGFPWCRLKTLILDDHNGSLTDLLTTLSYCTSLVHFSFSLRDSYYPSQTLLDISRKIPEDSIVIPNLTHLTFSDPSSHFEKRILPFLRLPSLQYVTFGVIHDSIWGDGNKPGQALVNLILRSRCVLTELRLKHHSYESGQDSFAKIFEIAPQLRSLHIDFTGSSAALRSVFCPQDSAYLCPSIEKLTLHHCLNLDMANFLVDVVDSRVDNHGTSFIRTLKLVERTYNVNRCAGPHNKSKAIVEEGLRRHITGGLDLQLLLVQIDGNIPEWKRIDPLLEDPMTNL